MRFMCVVPRDIKELCCDKFFLVKSNVSTNFVATERKHVSTEIPATEMRFYFFICRDKKNQCRNKVQTVSRHNLSVQSSILPQNFAHFHTFNYSPQMTLCNKVFPLSSYL